MIRHMDARTILRSTVYDCQFEYPERILAHFIDRPKGKLSTQQLVEKGEILLPVSAAGHD